jgi:hypothetical protein
MPEENPSTDPSLIAKAVADGVKQAFLSDEILNALSKSQDLGGSSTGTQRNVSGPAAVQQAIAHAFSNSDSPMAGAVSSHASIAKQILNDAVGGEYMHLPQGLGGLEGGITPQNIAQFMTSRQLQRIANTNPGYFASDIATQKTFFQTSPEMEQAVQGYKRSADFQNKVIPAYSIMKTAYQQYLKPAYGFMQQTADLGNTQLVGGVGGDINVGPFGFRNPFNRGFNQGLGIEFHNIGQALGAGINMQQQGEISGALMKEGFNFNNPQYGLGEAALQNVVRYNPAINTQLAAQQYSGYQRADSVDAVANLTVALQGLGSTAKAANLSINEVQQRMANFQQLTNNGPFAGGNFNRLQTLYPMTDPSSIIQTLSQSPLGQAAALDTGLGFGFQVPTVAGSRGGALLAERAYDETLKNSLTTAGVPASVLTNPAMLQKYLSPFTNEGSANLALTQSFGKLPIGGMDLYREIQNAPQRLRLEQASSYLSRTIGMGGGRDYGAHEARLKGLFGQKNNQGYSIDPTNGALDYMGGMDPHHGHLAEIDRNQISRQDALHTLDFAGVSQSNKAKFMRDYYISAGTTSVLKKGGEKALEQLIKDTMHGDKPSAAKLDKVIQGLQDAMNGMRDYKNSIPTGGGSP